jgi:hypothetical protein
MSDSVTCEDTATDTFRQWLDSLPVSGTREKAWLDEITTPPAARVKAWTDEVDIPPAPRVKAWADEVDIPPAPREKAWLDEISDIPPTAA